MYHCYSSESPASNECNIEATMDQNIYIFAHFSYYPKSNFYEMLITL